MPAANFAFMHVLVPTLNSGPNHNYLRVAPRDTFLDVFATSKWMILTSINVSNNSNLTKLTIRTHHCKKQKEYNLNISWLLNASDTSQKSCGWAEALSTSHITSFC